MVSNLSLAYIDPGTGSMLVQAVAGGVAAAAVVVKVYWRRLRKLLRLQPPEEDPAELPAPPE